MEGFEVGGRRRAEGALLAGIAAGLALAAVGLAGSGSAPPEDLPDEAVAVVNGRVILEDDYRRLLAGLASERRTPLGPEDRRRVLDRLIEEELLVQRGLELGLVRSDRRVRGELVSSVIGAVVSEAESREPEQEELRRFYDENRDYFTRPGRARVREILVRRRGETPEAVRARAEEIVRRLRAGEAFEAVAGAVGDAPPLPVPDALLPPAKLQEYLGPTATLRALELEAGGVTEPISTGSGYRVVQLVEREAPRTPPFEEVEALVRAEWRRRAGDRALRRYLGDLRRRSEVRVREPLP